jgi:glycosyltransferase involved in cell wall biosynthesis
VTASADSRPHVTVILPARNAGQTIDLALSSVLGQTFDDFEVLALDDGSTDDTAARMQAWRARDARVRVVSTGGLGLIGALNLGLQHALGELIARMDADDESLPTRFEKSVAALDAHPDWAGVGTGVEIVRADRPPSPNLQAYGRWLSSLTSPELVFRDRFIESPLCHPSMTLRRRALVDAGGWRDGPFPEDWELWLRLLERGEKLSCLPEVLHRWTDHDRRLTRTDARYALERHLSLKADYVSRVLKGRPVTLWGATDTGRALSKALTANGLTVVRFVELNAKKIGQTIHGVPVIHPDALPDDGSHVLSCVAAKGARDDIRAFLQARGRVELRDFTCLA